MNAALFEYTEAYRMKIWFLLNSSSMEDSSKCFSFQIWARYLYKREKKKGKRWKHPTNVSSQCRLQQRQKGIRQDVTMFQGEFIWFPSKSNLNSFLTISTYTFIMILLRLSTFSQSLFLSALVGHSLLTRVTIILLFFC